MTQEQQPAVVEWGSSERLSRRTALGRSFASIRRHRLVVPVVAALGALAVFASLVSDWQVTTLEQTQVGPDSESIPPVGSGLAELSGWTAGYLAGLFALFGCLGLVLFGRPAFRDQARVLGLTTAGVLGGMLVALAVYLGETSPALLRVMYYPNPDEVRFDLTYGPGLTMAFLGVGALAAALYLAGHALPAPALAPGSARETGEAGEAKPEGAADDWPWRRPGTRADEPEAGVPQPIDLTVTPTTPFVPLGEGAPPDGPKPDGPKPGGGDPE